MSNFILKYGPGEFSPKRDFWDDNDWVEVIIRVKWINYYDLSVGGIDQVSGHWPDLLDLPNKNITTCITPLLSFWFICKTKWQQMYCHVNLQDILKFPGFNSSIKLDIIHV